MDTNEFLKKDLFDKQETVIDKEPDLDAMSPEELQKLKRFLFEERIRILQEQEKFEEAREDYEKANALMTEEK